MTGKPPALTADMVFNLLMTQSRAALMRSMNVDPRRNLDEECGYPLSISIQNYRDMYDRQGLGNRVVGVFPDESWAIDPIVAETELQSYTPFEKAWVDLNETRQTIHYLHRLDRLSGIGRYGVLLIGLDDGLGPDQAADGIDEFGRAEEDAPKDMKVNFFRAFDEKYVNINRYEGNWRNPRYGLPVEYTLTMANVDSDGVISGEAHSTTELKVHWSRILHAADNCEGSEVFGVPRMQPVFNHLLDVQKVLGGSAEMFWKGAFPGYAFQVNPDLLDADFDKESMRSEFEAYQNGLQRYIAAQGVEVKSLAVQVASPQHHMDEQIKAIAITLGVPVRVLIGSEEAKLASTQDTRTWNKRLNRRQQKYLTPRLMRPFVDRLVMLGVLPKPAQYFVSWPDLNNPTDADRAAVAQIWTQALERYVTGGIETMIPPLEFLTHILEMPIEKAKAIVEAAERAGVELKDVALGLKAANGRPNDSKTPPDEKRK